MKNQQRYVVAMTGASGSLYGKRVVTTLLALGHEVHFLMSPSAEKVCQAELDISINGMNTEEVCISLTGSANTRFIMYTHHDIAARISSGSFRHDGMVIVPCSMGTVGRVASGSSSNLIDRSADVTLKERRTLIVVPRETPLSLIHLEQMTRLTRAGAIVLPAMPGFYNRPKSIEDMVDFVVARIFDHLKLDHHVGKRYLDE